MWKQLGELNSLVRIYEHALQEWEQFWSADDRAFNYISSTKTNDQTEEMKKKLLDYMQTPPERKQNQTDWDYIVQYEKRDTIVSRYQKLLHLLQ
jgi:hypothetical protein